MTDGRDKGSKHTWGEVRELAQRDAVAIFGMVYVPGGPGRPLYRRPEYGTPLHALCELSGGLVLASSDRDEDWVLRWLMQTLRERYIVEFPRPSNGTGGIHSLDIKVDRANAVVRSTGITVPLKSQALKADPTTIPSDPSLTPEMGSRRVLSDPK